MKVVDASVVLRWLLEEPSDKSAALIEAHARGNELLVAPELIHYEVGNVLATKLKLTSGQAGELFCYYLDIGIQTYSLGTEEYKTAVELALRFKLSVYDASYLALAQALGTRLATADKKLAATAASLGLIDRV